MRESDFKIKKFSLDAGQLDAVEAAIQMMALRDLEQALDTADPTALARASLLAQRRQQKPLGCDLDLRGEARVPIPLADWAREVRLALKEHLNHLHDAWPLTAVIVLMEVRLANPLAEDPALTLSEVAATDTLREVLAALPTLNLSIEDGERVALEALTAAEGAYGKTWADVAKTMGVVLVVGVGSVLAGPLLAPVIGGFIGTTFLGLSGAAAVSAGLALLGGGSLAAGGFGMVGGTAVVTAALGAAGLGAGAGARKGLESLFLAEHGDVAARVAMVRHLAVYHALLGAGLLDFELAVEFREAIDTLRQGMEPHTKAEKEGRIIKRLPEEARRATQVVKVLQKAAEAAKRWQGKAVEAGTIHARPVAYRVDADVDAGEVEDQDFKDLVRQFQERQRLMRRLVRFISHIHRPTAEVKEERWFAAVLSALSGTTRRRLLQADGHLQLALEEVLVLLNRLESEGDSLAAAIYKARVLQEHVDARNAVIERFETLLFKAHRSMTAVRAENSELQAKLVQMRGATEATLARMLVANAFHRAASSPTRPALSDGQQRQQAHRAEARTTDPRILVAIGLGSDASEVHSTLTKMRAAGHSLPDIAEVHSAMKALDVPLGTPMADVESTFRSRVAQVHPDRAMNNEAARVLMERETRHLSAARDLHAAYHSLAGETA